jgi:hypothetical protein
MAFPAVSTLVTLPAKGLALGLGATAGALVPARGGGACALIEEAPMVTAASRTAPIFRNVFMFLFLSDTVLRNGEIT